MRFVSKASNMANLMRRCSAVPSDYQGLRASLIQVFAHRGSLILAGVPIPARIPLIA
jgi:hypothetical protein